MRNFVRFLLPESGNTFSDQLEDCFKQLQIIIDGSFSPLKVITITFFVASRSYKQNQQVREIIKSRVEKFFGDSQPATACVAQSPENGSFVGLEVSLHYSSINKLVYKKFENIPYVVVDHNSYKEVFVSGITGKNDEDIQRISDKAFSLMEKILETESMDFSNIVRQWNYIEDITSLSVNSQKYQHYQVFNDVRSDYYNKSKFNNGYPSATGIGTEAFGVIINFIAVSNASNVKLIPVVNPEQIDAHRYSQKVLVGEEYHKSSPKFERGKLVVTDEGSKMYISGTAAIVGEDTLFPGDVEKQTMVTINNIKQLVKNALTLQSKDTQLSDRNKYTYIRAYVKYKKDIDIVMEICEKHFASECFQYLISDICRDDLLVEIEGLMEI